MKANITITGNDIVCSSETTASGEIRIPLDDDIIARMKTWAERYDRIVRLSPRFFDPTLLPDLGREIFSWIDVKGWASSWARSAGDMILEIAVNETKSKAAEALLDLPWEALFFEDNFLASDPHRPFVVYRRIGPQGAANRWSPSIATWP